MSDPNAGVLMFVAHRAFEQRVISALHDAGFAVSLAQARLFARVDPAGTRLTELAERAQVTKQSAGFLVDQLERAGFVERVADPVDARARLVRVAARGDAVIALAREVEQEVLAEWTQHLGEEDMTQLVRALLRLREITDPFAR